MPTVFIADDQQEKARRASPVRWKGFAATIGAVGAATLLKLAAFDHIGTATPFLLYFTAIIVAAWFGGWRGGLFATAVSGLLGNFFFLPPFGSLTVLDASVAVRLAIFLMEGVVVTAIVARLHGERARADAAARDSQGSVAKLEGVLRGVGDGITVQSARGELVYVNDTAAKLTGFASADDLLAAPVSEIMTRFELLAPDGSPFPPAELPGRLALRGLPATERLIRFRVRATGEERWALVRASAVKIEGSDVPYAVNVFQDVTEARKQEEALRLSREWFSTTLRSIGDAVIATDAGGRVTFVNPLAEQLTGWSAADAEGKPLLEVFRLLNEDTRQPSENPVDRVLREGKVVGLANHTILVSRRGTEVAIDDSAAPIRSPTGDLVGTVLVFRDVSERRADERRKAFIARATAELASSLDYRRTLTTIARLAVPAVADWCAVDTYEEGRLHRLAVEHVDPKKVGLVYEIERRYPANPDAASGSYQVARSRQPLFLGQIPDEMLVAAARDEEHLRLIRSLELRSLIAVPLGSNETLGVLSLAMAESGRQYAPADLDLALSLADRATLAIESARLFATATEARTDAERANRAKDEFLAMLGHELRNPLAPMLTALQLMKLRAPAFLERERSILERQVKHVVTLVDDLLDVSRITSGKVELAREPVDLHDTLAKALELVGPLIEERRHEVVTTFAEGLVVFGDPVRLAQVLSNLLANAAKYTGPGGRIEVLGAREGEEVVVRVRDNGVGIHPELLPRVFDLFVQAGQPLDRAKGGLGLGLTIVRSVAELHGGRVSAVSAGPGQGSEFRVALPAYDGAVAAKAEVGPSWTPGERAGGTVLVVDDNDDARELLAEALALVGYETHAAADAAAALAEAQKTRPDVALLDIGLPVIDGYELARQLRSTAGLEDIKLVAVTGYGQPTDKERTRQAGFDEHLVKPISVEEVQRVLQRLLPTG